MKAVINFFNRVTEDLAEAFSEFRASHHDNFSL